jgi:hypothetical protein
MLTAIVALAILTVLVVLSRNQDKDGGRSLALAPRRWDRAGLGDW